MGSRIAVAFFVCVFLFAHANAQDEGVEEVIVTCWAAYSTLSLIGREDGQSLVAQLFKDQAYSVWNFGLQVFKISPLDPRYTEVRDDMLSRYRESAISYDEIMQLSFICDKHEWQLSAE